MPIQSESVHFLFCALNEKIPYFGKKFKKYRKKVPIFLQKAIDFLEIMPYNTELQLKWIYSDLTKKSI